MPSTDGGSGSFFAEVQEDLLERADQVFLVHLALPERHRKVVAPVRRLELEDVRPASSAFVPLVSTQPLAEVVAVQAATRDLFEEPDHLRLLAGLEHLQQQ